MITSNRSICEILDFNPIKCNLLKDYKWCYFLRLCIKKNSKLCLLPNGVEGLIGSYLDVGNKEYYFNLTKIHLELKRALKNSMEGNEFLLKYNIDNIKNLTETLPIDFYKEIKIFHKILEKNKKKYLERSIMRNLAIAKNFAFDGDEDSMKYTLDKTIEYANAINIDIKDHVKLLYTLVNENVHTYFSNKIDRDLSQAKKYALEGDYDMVKYTTSRLSYYSEKINIDISNVIKENNFLVEKNKKKFTEEKIKKEISNTFKYAIRGDRFLVDYMIKTISFYAKEINANIDDEVTNIYKILRES